MLDRLEIAFADQKDFLSDVSHELRTPITVDPRPPRDARRPPREREEAIAVIQDELDRMSRYVDDLLLLAKAPRPDFLRLGRSTSTSSPTTCSPRRAASATATGASTATGVGRPPPTRSGSPRR